MPRSEGRGRKILIVAESMRRASKPSTPIPAIDRFQRVYFGVIKKSLREGSLKNVDVLILTGRFGLIQPQKPIAYYDTSKGHFGELKLRQDQIIEANKRNIDFLTRLQKEKRYAEVYVNVGTDFMKLLTGIERVFANKIDFARGPGLGPKAAHMKNWILRKARVAGR